MPCPQLLLSNTAVLLAHFVRDILIEVGTAPSRLRMEPSGLGRPGTAQRPADIGVYLVDYCLYIDVTIQAVLSVSSAVTARDPGGVARQAERVKTRSIKANNGVEGVRRESIISRAVRCGAVRAPS